jgi:predicted glycosyltransferase
MTEKRIIWFDFTNVPHVNFLRPIINHYTNDFKIIYSLRDFAETAGLFEKKIGEPYFKVGKHLGSSKIKKIQGSFKRIVELQKTIPYFDIKISVGGDASSFVAKLRNKLSITFDDNEKAPNWRYAPFSDFTFWPSVIPLETLHKQFFKDDKIYRYNGYKEDLYIADYVPDTSFKEKLPFDSYVVVRPENLNANYVEGNKSIVNQLLVELTKRNINIIFLPRYESDRQFAKSFKNIFIPSEAIDGLDACYYADAVLTGAGTMAREAACLGVPAVSFYAGKELLTVDQSLISHGRMFFSRNVEEIINYLGKAMRKGTFVNASKDVKTAIISRLDKVIFNYL